MPSTLRKLALAVPAAVSGLWVGLVAAPAHAALAAESKSWIEGGMRGLLLCVAHFDAMVRFEAESRPCHGFQAVDLALVAVVALVVIAVIRFRHATSRKRLELARRMVEQGMEPPAELLGSKTGNDLRRGIVLVCAGLGLLLASHLGGDEKLSPAGLIPGFIGIGYLLSHRFAAIRQRRRESP